MKTTKTILSTVILITVISIAVNAQTNVSGGIYTNTTWTLANSPYIVVDTVVVFPNVTLTIEPGVMVKFNNNKRLEIRQAQLIAIGTPTDIITFTSNGPGAPGLWNSLFINGANYNSSTFNYCNFFYAAMAILDGGDSTIIKNSNFRYNSSGVSGGNNGGNNRMIDSCNFKYNGYGVNSGNYNCVISNSVFRQNTGNGLSTGYNSEIKNCIINLNQTGIFAGYNSTISNCTIDSNAVDGVYIIGGSDSIINCEINHNGIGINNGNNSSGGNVIIQNTIENNTTGINSSGNNSAGGNVITQNIIENNTTGISTGCIESIYCNKICNNNNYDLLSTMPNSINVANNYWCTSDSTNTATVIYDGYDNISLGLVTFMPIDTVNCYLLTAIPINSFENNSFSIFPNPFSNQLTITSKTNNQLEVSLYDITSRKILNQIFTNSTSINTSHLAKGIYLYEVRNKNGVIKQGKVVKD